MKVINYLFLLISALSFGQIIQVKDINPGTANSSTPSQLFDFNGTLFFRATDGATGVELWKSDGTFAGTTLVKDINPAVSSTSNSNPSNFTLFQNDLYFTASNGSTINGSELWKTNGTDAGTVLVKDINTGTASGNPQNFTVINPTTMLFSATEITMGNELWKTDGTSAGTVSVVDYPGNANSITWIENLNGTAILGQIVSTTGRELYKSDGTSANTSLIVDINPGTALGVGTNYFKNGNTLYFQGNSGTTGLELWKTDGTSVGTQLVKDINPGTTTSSPGRFANVGLETFFRATGPNGQELWKTDGTAAGTVEVVDLNTTGSSNPDQIQSINDVLYFFAADNGVDFDLYKYDKNTLTKLKDFNAKTATVLTDYVLLNGVIYFAADGDGDSFRELWQTDGTADATVLVSSLVSGSINPTNVTNITKIGSKLFFSATNADGQELFSYSPVTLSLDNHDGIEVLNIFPNPSNGDIFLNNINNLSIQYEVYDLLGKKQLSGQTSTNKINLNLQAGIYVLKLNNNSKISTIKIIIK